MKQARGEMKQVIRNVAEIQSLIGRAIGMHEADRDPNGFRLAQAALREAFELCIETAGAYYPTDAEPKKAENQAL